VILYYINSTDRSADVRSSTLRISNQIQQRSDAASFEIFQNTKPSENQDVQIFFADTIASFAGTTVTLDGNFERNVVRFFAGQKLRIRIGDSDEETVEVSSYTESTLEIELVTAPSGSVSQGDKIGTLMFGGVVSRVRDKNVGALTQLEYGIDCVDYSKIFDRKLISDTWEDVDSRFIINSFVNSTINFNSTLDDMDYDDNAAIQAAWIETGDGDNPTIDSSDFIEGDAAGVLNWTNAGGTATFTGTVTSKDVSTFTGAASGAPTEGEMMIWLNGADVSTMTDIKLRVGSDASNYAEFDLEVPDTDGEWQYYSKKFVNASITGTPDWTAVDTVVIVITETGSSSLNVNGIRVNQENSFTLFNVAETKAFDDFRSPQLKPTVLVQQLAKSWEYIWYIDYFRDIHFKDSDLIASAYNLTETSDNFTDLEVEVDQSQLGNRIIIRGGEKTSTSLYAQVFQGDDTLREWILKNKFKNLTITLDDNSSTDTMEAGTTTTTVKATGHGLAVGDHIVQRSRGDVVREVLTAADADTFTVEAVTGQTNGDTFSKFDTAKTDGIEGISDETTVDYVANSNEKSVRATASEATLTTSDFLRFSYNERTPIQVRYTDSASANAMKALGYGDGVFDLDPITDRNIQDVATALALAQARVNEFSNALILGSFRTDQHGLQAGQTIHITDSNRSIDDDYVIQRVNMTQNGGQYHDYVEYRIQFGTTLFGVIEFYQKLLKSKDSVEQNVDDVVETYVTPLEDIEFAETNQTATDGGFLTATGNETIESSETNVIYDTDTWRWEPNGVGQTLDTRWDLFEWG